MATQVQRKTRAPRFKVPNNEPAVISVGAERMGAILDCLSLTGGRFRSTKRVASGTFADIEMKTVSGNFTAAIELLGTAQGNTQAFRFVQMGPSDRTRLQDALRKMHAHGLGEDRSGGFNSLVSRVRGMFAPLSAR